MKKPMSFKYMDNVRVQKDATFASNLKSAAVTVEAGANHSNDAVARVDSLGLSSSPSFVNGGKRKHGMLDGSINVKHKASLLLGFGHSLSSCTSISSGKEAEERESLSLGLGVELQLGSGATSNMENALSETSKEQEPTKPKLDLELSLLTGPAESHTTTLKQCSSAYQHMVVGSVQ